MLISFAFVLIIGMLMGWLCSKIKLPPLLGMIVTGIVLGPHLLNLIDISVLNISAEIRRMALIIILTRAGLALDLGDLKKVGRPAILMCFVPACFEMLGMVIVAPKLFGVTIVEAAIMGSVVAAVSPAVIVPKMIEIIEGGYGAKHSIPQLILAGASVDDVFVIVMFTAFTGFASGGDISPISFLKVPVAIILGIVCGMLIGWCLAEYFKRTTVRGIVKAVIILCVGFIVVTIEDKVGEYVPFSGLIAVMSMGIALQQKNCNVARAMSAQFSKLWVVAEVLLFVLVGATVDINYAIKAGALAVVVIISALVFRAVGVLVCMIKTKLSVKERAFCMIAYMPKATVQAAIGGVPLAMGLACGDLVLTMAVLSILITAPLGALLIDAFYKKLLCR